MVVERYASLKVGAPQPRELELSWFVSAATLRLPVTNQSNYAATVHLQGVDRERQCDFTFYTDHDTDDHIQASGSDLDAGIVGAAHLVLQPGQTVTVPVEVRTRQRPWIGLAPHITPFRVVARMDTEPPRRRAADGQLAVAALIGPWQMAIAAVLGVVAIFGTGLAGLALLVALRSASLTQVAPPAATPLAAAPVVAFVIQMDQPMPTRVPASAGRAAPAELVPQADQNSALMPDTVGESPGVPIVSADQVTAPGEPTPVGQRQLRPLVVEPVVVTTPVAQGRAVQEPSPTQNVPAQTNNANLTYGQMFKQVASLYDLDWRLLAAQAYLESGFDSLALSGDGDMGLMQIRPATWNEWAPTVDASDPFDSYSNVLVGAVYLNYLREQLSARGFPQQEWMLVAYSWGPDKVFSHVDSGGTWESLDPERRQYADDILRIAASIPVK
jgi:soluble lytic murein transglycosylase-like protein